MSMNETSGRSFLSTPSARRATCDPLKLFQLNRYFYPRPPRGGRPTSSTATTARSNFYPRPPRGGRPSPIRKTAGTPSDFYPRPPRGGRPASIRTMATGADFYPRPPRGGRQHRLRHIFRPVEFLSTPSARRATGKQDLLKYSYGISIHALREEGDCAT